MQYLERYEKYQSEEKRNKRRSIKECRRVNLKLLGMLEANGMETHPLKIRRREVYFLHDSIPLGAKGNFRNRQYHLDLFTGFLRWCGNESLPKLTWPEGNRTNADWLDETRMETIRLSVEDDPELALIFHLAGDYAMRRVEIMRAEVQDFDGLNIHIRGKGKGDCKPRNLKRHPDTDHYMARYMELRDSIVRRARMDNPDLEEPTGLFVYHRGNRLGTYKETALDTRVERMRTLSGVQFKGYHTLRRTCAREWWFNGAPIETVSEMLGHEDLSVTKRYLGISFEDHESAYNLRAKRQQQIRASLRAKTLNRPLPPPTKAVSEGDWQ